MTFLQRIRNRQVIAADTPALSLILNHQPVTPTNSASLCQCLGCGIRLPAWMSEEYGSLTPKSERICDFATLESAG
jgi:hypothetical protein